MRKGILFLIVMLLAGCMKHDVPPYGVVLSISQEGLRLFTREPSLPVRYDSLYTMEGLPLNLNSAFLIFKDFNDTLYFADSGNFLFLNIYPETIYEREVELNIFTENGLLKENFRLPEKLNLNFDKDTLFISDTLRFNRRLLENEYCEVVFTAGSDSFYASARDSAGPFDGFIVLCPDSFYRVNANGRTERGLSPGIYELNINLHTVYTKPFTDFPGFLFWDFYRVEEKILIVDKESF